MLANSRRKRYELISEILAGMRVLRLRMLNSLEPLGILLRKSDCSLFCELGNSLWEGGGLNDCWQELRNARKGNSGPEGVLHEDDLQLLDTFFAGLGGSGREEQTELFASIIGQMEETQAQARKSYIDASKIYTALGTLIGIAVCIMIV